MDGLFDAVANVFGASQRKWDAKKQRETADEESRRYMDLLRQQDRTPELVSDRVGTYQRSRSPIADAFLESMLTGQNPAAVQGTRAGATGQRATAQRAFDQQTGGMDVLRDRQRRAMAATPWLADRVPLSNRLNQQNVDPRAPKKWLQEQRQAPPPQRKRDEEIANEFFRGGR